MTKNIKWIFLVISFAMTFATVSAQDYSVYLNAAKKHLQNGNIEKAESVYDVYKQLTGLTDTEYENAVRELTKASFEEIREFNLGYACARIGNKWGVVNEKMEIVIPVIYDKIWDFWQFSPKQTTTAAIRNGQMGFVNIQGEEVTEFKYRAIRGIELHTPNIYFYVYQWDGPEVYVDMNGVEYATEHEAAYGTKGLKQNNKVTVGPYKVGDPYNVNGYKGVVFEVDDTGFHGKIVNVEQEFMEWAIKDNKYFTQHVGAFDEFDGEQNMNKIKQITNWRYIFPAFEWCHKMGNGWYLPAKYELKNINDNLDYINNGLRLLGYRPINETNYFSSTENKNVAGHVYYLWGLGDNPGIFQETDKESCWVLAVKKF